MGFETLPQVGENQVAPPNGKNLILLGIKFLTSEALFDPKKIRWKEKIEKVNFFPLFGVEKKRRKKI